MSSETAAARTQGAPRPGLTAAWAVVLLGWLVPGLGYFLLRKWIRGALVLICVAGMFGLGLALRGQLYGPNTGDVLEILGWIGDVSAGGLYFLTRAFGGGVGNPFLVMGDYGTKFLIVAGLLNLLAATDARDVALGRKP